MITIKKLLNLDIFDLNWDISSKEINQVESMNSGKYGILEGLGRCLIHVISSVRYVKFNTSNFNKDIVILCGTKNQLNALNNIKDIGNVIEFGNMSNKKSNNSFEAIPYLISLAFIPLLLFKIITEKDEFRKKNLKCRFDRYLFSYGLVVFFLWVIKPERNKLIIVSNDHSVWQRSMMFAAKLNGVKTAYVQHANVSNKFPPLDFDFAFLDGCHSKNTYNIRENCVAIKVGCVRFEEFQSILNNTEKKFLGDVLICFNKTDTDLQIRDVIKNIKNKLSSNQRVGVRLHPSDNRGELLLKIKEEMRFAFYNESDAELDSVLSRYSYCFAGLSSIFLEAALSNLKCCSVSNIFDDYYNYEKDGIVTVFPSWEEFELSKVPNKKDVAKQLYDSCESNLVGISKPSLRIKYILRDFI
ncbi:TPA: hypothetical protein P0E35_003077 [Vibrio harveyi]|nr:hypothetical protein [Vibrio harveyi]